nr:hypothetical protein [Oryctes rhinoceros nudivirus]
MCAIPTLILFVIRLTSYFNHPIPHCTYARALVLSVVYKLGNGGQLLSVGFMPTFRKHGGTTLI